MGRSSRTQHTAACPTHPSLRIPKDRTSWSHSEDRANRTNGWAGALHHVSPNDHCTLYPLAVRWPIYEEHVAYSKTPSQSTNKLTEAGILTVKQGLYFQRQPFLLPTEAQKLAGSSGFPPASPPPTELRFQTFITELTSPVTILYQQTE